MTTPHNDPNAAATDSADSADSFNAEPDLSHAPAHVPAHRDDTVRDVVRDGANQRPADPGKPKGSFAASTWVALIVGFLLLILLIIFILQNMQEVELNFLSWTVHFPAGIAFLIFAIAGALIMALVGGWRMFELRRQLKKQAKLYG